jgi:hypothetical protein
VLNAHGTPNISGFSLRSGHKNNIDVTQRHYSPWGKLRQDALEAAVKANVVIFFNGG